MTAPEGFDWATSASALVTEPSAATKGNGFIPLTPLSAEYMNWLLQQAGRAATFVAGWSDLAEFIDEAAEEQLGLLTEDAEAAATQGTTKGSRSLSTDALAIATDGRRVWVGQRSQGSVLQYPRALSANDASYLLAHPTSPAIKRIVRAGEKLLTLYTQGGTDYVDCHTVADSGSLIAAAWTYTSPGGALNDIAAVSDTVFVAREAGYVVPIPLSTGTAGTAYNHGAAVRSVAASGSAVYLAGALGTGSATMRRLAYALGGLVDVTAGGLEGPWDITSGPVMTAGGRLAADPKGLAVAWTAAETLAATVELRAPVTGEVTASAVYAPTIGGFAPDTVPTQLAMDDGALFLVIDSSAGTVGCVCRFDRPDLSLRWRYLTGAAAGVEVYSVATDGSVVFVGTDTASSTNALRSVYRGNSPRMVVRRASSVAWPHPYHSFEATR